MKSKFHCSKCKLILENKNEKLFCSNCNESFSIKNGYADFLKGEKFDIGNISKDKVIELLQKIEQDGYKKASLNFLNDPIIKPELLDVKSADLIFHGLGKNNFRCLEIGSNLGKTSENLSHIFREVYCVETTEEKIEFQQKRFQYLDKNNITLLACNPINLPFPDNYFDFILCNGVFESCQIFNSNSKQSQIKFLKEMKRVLSKNGCLCLSVQNKFGVSQLFGLDKINKIKKNTTPQFLHSLSGYQKLLKNEKFISTSYWILPSNNKPYFSGRLDDNITLKWFFKNITKFMLKGKKSKIKKFFLFIMQKIDRYTLNNIIKIFVPNFIFYCYKNNNKDTIEELIMEKTGMNNFLSISRKDRILNILLDKKSNPKKIISVGRYGYEIPKKIVEPNRTFTNMKDPKDRIWMENWIEGKLMNPLKIKEVLLAINWLYKFQKDTKQGILTKKFVNETELDWIKVGLLQVNGLDFLQCEKWLEEYESYVTKNTIYKTAIHGDFWINNILINLKTNDVELIDWEKFRAEGSPFTDSMTFIMRLMLMDSKNQAESFKANFRNKHKMNLINELYLKMNNYFGIEIKLLVIMRWFIMSEIAYSKLFVNSERVESYVKILKFLSNKNTFFNI